MKVLRTVGKSLGAGVMSLGLVVGLSGFNGVANAATGTIHNTGPSSYNKIKSKTHKKVRITNNNDLGLQNNNAQNAHTGKAKVTFNTTGGHARTGDARNSNTTRVSATVNNAASASQWAGVVSGSGGGGNHTGNISQTGPTSTNVVKAKTKVDVKVMNNNNIQVSNNNVQSASSGKAKVVGNTTGGDAVTGDASNTNSSTFEFKISN